MSEWIRRSSRELGESPSLACSACHAPEGKPHASSCAIKIAESGPDFSAASLRAAETIHEAHVQSVHMSRSLTVEDICDMIDYEIRPLLGHWQPPARPAVQLRPS